VAVVHVVRSGRRALRREYGEHGASPARGSSADPARTTRLFPRRSAAIMTLAAARVLFSSVAPTTCDRAASQEVKDLAARIDQEQGPEIEQMNQMLDAWGAPRPQPGSTTMPGMPGHGMPGMPMGGMPMQGMMTQEQMQQLGAQSGPGFDRMFLQMIIEHHTGAVQMAQTEQAHGLNPRAKELAGTIAGDQQREIAEMQALLNRV
jgi:uncharacterized protein (DUF305 family)